MRFSLLVALLLGVALSPLQPAEKKLAFDDRVEIARGLMAEYATVKQFLPRSKKPLAFESNGTYLKKDWEAVGREYGPAARVGDLVQITKVDLEEDRIILQINGGFKGGRKWYESLQVGIGNRTSPVSTGGTNAPGGTTIAILFHKPLEPIKAAEIKKRLATVLDFEKRSASEQYVETLPPVVQKAVREKRAIDGMDRDQVLLALGPPVRKSRETQDGIEIEDWIYGTPPGRIVFVTFNGNKVIRVKESYAGLGGEAVKPLPPR